MVSFGVTYVSYTNVGGKPFGQKKFPEKFVYLVYVSSKGLYKY